MSKKIKHIEFVLENCECIIVPIECFKELYIKNMDRLKNDDRISELKCLIQNNGQVNYSCGFNNTISPLTRLRKYDDITRIYIKYEDDTELHLYSCWDGDINNNYNQHSKLIDYKTLELNIIEGSRKYTLEQVLEDFKKGDIVKDSQGNIYEIKSNNNNNYIDIDKVDLELLNNTFTRCN